MIDLTQMTAATALFALSGCYLFTDEGRPCTLAGECLPGFVCVKEGGGGGLCQVAAHKQVNEECRATGECVAGLVCADAYCDDSSAAKCDNASQCQPGGEDKFNCYGGQCECQKVCRPSCDYPDFAKCQSGQLCWWQVEQAIGFCQEGNCGDREDNTHIGDCLDSEVCLEFNGKGSGLCNPKCDLLRQNSDCLQSPVPTGVLCCAASQNCEHIVQLWGTSEDPDRRLGICFDSGTQDESDHCSNLPADNMFCRRGLVCYNNTCRKYCNREPNGADPACGATAPLCTPFQGGDALAYGYCKPV